MPSEIGRHIQFYMIRERMEPVMPTLRGEFGQQYSESERPNYTLSLAH